MTVISTENQRFSNTVKAEQWAELGYCRTVATAYEAAAKTYKIGDVVGKTLTGGAGTATAGGSNTGDGTMGTVTVAGNAKTGTYTLKITKAATNAGDFQVVDPEGDVVGLGTVAVAFSGGGLSFTLADGAVDFAVGDTFSIAVTGTEKIKLAVETATDGSNAFYGVVLEDKSVAATTDTNVVVAFRGPMSVSKGGIYLDATYDNAAKKNVVYAAMESAGIQLLETV